MSPQRRTLLAATAALAASVTVGRPALAVPRTPRLAAGTANTWMSDRVQVGADGTLSYPTVGGLRIPDFGHAGYHTGNRMIPDVPVVHTAGPVSGDNTAHLQDAVDVVGAMPRGADGFRGALLLLPGHYDVGGTIRQPYDGVVIRGSGDGEDPIQDTILRATGNTPAGRDVLVVGGETATGWDGEVAGTRTDITTDLVQVGDDSFAVAESSRLDKGDNVIIVHPCSQAWLDAVDGGGTGADAPWVVGQLPIVHNRYITDISGDTITVDAPLFNSLDQSLAQSYVYRWDRSGLDTEVGVEDLRIDIQYSGGWESEEHAASGIRIQQAQDAWVHRCTILHFSESGVVTSGVTRVTIAGCRALDPKSQIIGGRRYNFNVADRSQQILFTDCHASFARHAFVSNGKSTVSGVVFHRTTATNSHTSSEGHRQWSQGLLFDNHAEITPATSRTIGLYNRGDYGTGHGWAAAHSVAWNTNTAGTALVVQQPPTAQNYAIGCFGQVSGDGPFSAPAGHIEGTGRSGLYPESLYEAQLAARPG